MANFLSSDLEYADGYYSTTDSDYESQSHGCGEDPFDSDFEDDLDTKVKSKTETTSVEVRNGKDIQGIPWERLNFTRDEYRECRLQQYKNFQNLSLSRAALDKECNVVENGNSFYTFQFNTRELKPTVVHFQLRNGIWATSKHDVYLIQTNSIVHWSAVNKKSKEVLNAGRPIVPTLKSPGTLSQSLSRVQVCTMTVKDNLLVVGGFYGEMICKDLNQPGVSFSTKLTMDANGITNAVDIFHSAGGSKRIMTANNDAQVRILDALSFSCLNQFSYDWSVNNVSASPDGKLVAVVGDSLDCLIADSQSGKAVSTLKGHLDYSFTSAWHPDGQILATGNQDKTCRLWDVRNTSESLAVLEGRIGSIRSLKFSSNGRFMAMAEAADFVHVFDTHSGFERGQEIDLFGEIAGISFSPDTEALFVGITDRTYGSLLEFNRKYYNQYLNNPFF